MDTGKFFQESKSLEVTCSNCTFSYNIDCNRWIQVSTTKHISFDQYSKYDIKGYLFLEFKNEGLIKSGIQVDAKFKFNGYSSQSQPIYDSQGKTLPVQIDKLKSSYTVTFNGYSNQWNNDPKNIDVSVDLTLNSIQSIPPVHPVVANIHKKIEEHWIKSKRFFEMQDDDDFKDFTFNVGNQDFKIHKCVFAGKNEVLRTMFLSEFDESSKNSTKITDIIPEVFQVLVDFMYGNKEGFNGKVKNFVYAVYAAAHKYQIEDLQEFCVEYVTENLTDPNHAIETYSFAHFYDLKQLKDKCWSAIKK